MSNGAMNDMMLHNDADEFGLGSSNTTPQDDDSDDEEYVLL
jgi:hypothetical protein